VVPPCLKDVEFRRRDIIAIFPLCRRVEVNAVHYLSIGRVPITGDIRPTLACSAFGATQVGLRRLPCGRASTIPGSLVVRRGASRHRQRLLCIALCMSI
jgi:hypothetical protein